MKHQETIIKLNADQYAAITVTDMETLKPIVVNATAAALTEKCGGVVEFFNWMFDKGYKTVRVQEKRKNGSTFIDKDMRYDFDLQAKTEAGPVPPPLQDIGLNGQIPALTGGMNQQAFYQAWDWTRLKGEYDRVNMENEARKAEILQLKEDALSHRFNMDKQKGNQDTMKSVFDNLPAIAGILKGLIGGGAAAAAEAQGMTGAIEQQLSEVKKQLIHFVRLMDEDSAAYLAAIAMKFSNQEFLAELDVIMNKYNTENAA